MQPGQPSPMPRRLLARLRDVMAGGGTAQERLQRIVTLIAGDMVAEVCSIYVQRAGEVLELFATQGLRHDAVHRTRLRVGEGLIGDIALSARPYALADAQNHPKFAFRPETGEEIYQSLMGVPILRDGRVIGVLAIQNRTRRHYAEEEVETLQTVAMVLAEMVAGGEVISQDELLPADRLMPVRLEGVRLNAGLGIGLAVLHQPSVSVSRLVAENADVERDRLRRAVTEMHGAIDAMLESDDVGAGASRDILEAYRMIAEDAGWMARIDEAVDGGLTAEAAVQKVRNDVHARMSQIADPYLRERVHDMEDLADRLLRHLVGDGGTAARGDLPDDVILIARSMGPAQLLDYERRSLRGLVLDEGSPTAHVTIVAHALDIPVVGHARDVLDKVGEGDPVVVDGDNAQVFIRPGEDVRRTFAVSLEERDQRRASYAAMRDLPAVTLDGATISLNINAGLLIDLPALGETGADGIGLYRTEIPFLVGAEIPDAEAQEAIYTRIYDAVENRPVIFRTLDIGGDKALPDWDQGDEENSAMGWRAIRVSLDLPVMLRRQFRALVRAADGRPLRIMFPMIAEVSEFAAARDLLDQELESEAARGTKLPEFVSVGAMVEVPALAFQLPALMARADFLSVGSNDLLQFLFASDRGSLRNAGRYDTLSPVVLTVLKAVLDACEETGVPLSLCGEMAGDPLDAMALIGLGFRSLSMAPPAIGPVKTMVRSLSLAPLVETMETIDLTTIHSLRSQLRTFALDHGVTI
jgi:phosphotransferase system, enzyme I, PtsP